jgi:hypothetical protein
MNKEDLYPLIGKYLNGYKIIKIEEDPFIKGQINLWTDEWITEYFGDKSLVKFFVRPESNSSKIYKELIDKEIYQLKDNWNKLKEYANKMHEYFLYTDVNEIYKQNMKEDNQFPNLFNLSELNAIDKVLNSILNKMQELEKGSDSNVWMEN